ncbi:MAG: glycosyltransferase [Bacillota bacterium]|nr:glycosyltransferase [Bacillota bacterium]
MSTLKSCEMITLIFETNSKKRWTITVIVFIILIFIGTALIYTTVYSIYTSIRIPGVSKLTMSKGFYITQTIKKIQKSAGPANTPSGNTQTNRLRPWHHRNKSRYHSYPAALNNGSGLLRCAFVNSNDDNSVNDLKQHIGNIDVAIPDYFSFVEGKTEINETVRSDIQFMLKKNHVMIIPRISNTDGNGKWFGQEFIDLINDEENRAALEALILSTLKKYDLRAINIDIENISDQNCGHYLDFLDELSDMLHRNNMYLTVDVPVNDQSFDYEEIGKVADLVFVMAYDENFESGSAGPIADSSWFDDGVETVSERIPKRKIIVASGQYAYDWNTDSGKPADALSFDETMLLANDVGADIQTDKDAQNSTFDYLDEKKQRHEVWLLDGVSMWNEQKEMEKIGVKGIALWRLGLEDPSVWGFYGRNLSKVNPSILSKTDMLNTVDFEGHGEILKVTTSPESGFRKLLTNGGTIEYADYDKLPKSYTVEKFGHRSDNQVALTFDDGPDPVYTPQVLDVLKKYGVNATFFVVGQQAQKYPYLLKRETGEGNLIGNHTYYHPNMAEITPARLGLELNATQRLIQAVTGRDSTLFRSPYDTNSTPGSTNELVPLRLAGEKGYVSVCADVDSEDYLKPGVDKIVNNIITQLKDSGSNIIVMHDAGGNRDQTVAALKKLIPLLRSKGYRFVSVNDLLGVPKDALMPEISFRESVLVFADKITTFVLVYGWDLIVILFFITTVISIFRIMFLGFFVLKSHKNSMKYQTLTDFQPFISVLIPAYNEEGVIAKTIGTVLKSSYKNFEVIVINDGSTDKTGEIVDGFVQKYPNVRQIIKTNGGKFSALNLGFTEAKADYIVTIDADTIVLPDTLGYLALPFEDPSVDAVCGNVQVGNVKNILTGFQTVEYITTQNYDRRAFDSLNCIGVVPGATGAWRKAKVIEAGGYSNETLTEDADLTLTMLEHNAKIVYMPFAKSITESPETVKTLSKQRFRWSFGTLQTLFKHKKSFFKGTMGCIALPNILVFQLIFPVLSPIGDLVFILSIFKGEFKAILAGYILFLMMDLAGSVIAFTIEKAPMRYLWLVLIQRFFYRQFMYIITFRSIIAAIKGRRHGWNKLDRTSSVSLPATEVI